MHRRWRGVHGLPPPRRGFMPLVQSLPGPASPLWAHRISSVTHADTQPGELIALLGGVFFASDDPIEVAAAVARWISAGGPLGLGGDQPDQQLVDTARLLLNGMPPAEIRMYCLAGAAWV